MAEMYTLRPLFPGSSEVSQRLQFSFLGSKHIPKRNICFHYFAKNAPLERSFLWSVGFRNKRCGFIHTQLYVYFPCK